MREIGKLPVHLNAYDFADHGRLIDFGRFGGLGVSRDTSTPGFGQHGVAWCGIAGSRDGESRKSDLIRNGFELHRQGEIEGQPGVRHVRLGEARDQPHTLLHLAEKNGVRNVGRERRMERVVHDRPAVNSRPASRSHPFPTNRMAPGTHRPRWVSPAGALLATLEAKLPTRAVRIESGPHRVVGSRNRACQDRHRIHPLPRIATLPSPKSPQPVTNPSCGSGTCAPPASCRSWRTASTTWLRPQA
jgi:hypothetical protein